jgi:hypothetical protein
MKVEQISIFLENKAGRLAEVTRILGEGGINIRALSLADTSDFGILRLIVNDHEKAKKILKEHGFTVGRTEVVAVEVEDRPGGLSSILQILYEAGINVEYMYAFVQQMCSLETGLPSSEVRNSTPCRSRKVQEYALGGLARPGRAG